MSSPSLEQLTRDLTQLGQASAAMRAGSVSGELVDQTGHVHVEVDSAGRITHLRLGNRWQDDISPQLLGATILSVPTQAVLRSTIEAVRASREAISGDRRAPEPVEVPSARYEFPPSAASELTETILRLNRETESFQSLPDDQRYREPAEVHDDDQPRSANGRVVASISAGRVVDLVIDPAWAERTATQAITDAVLEALEQAHQRIDEVAEGDHGAGDDARLGPEGRAIRADLATVNQILSSYRRS